MPADPTLWLAYVFVLGATVCAQVVIGYWVVSRRWGQRGATWFLVMVVAGLVWTVPILLELMVSNPTLQRAAHVVGIFGALLGIGAFAVFASQYTGSTFHRNRLVQACLAVPIGSYVVLALTNGVHGLLWADLPIAAEPFPYVAAEHGSAMWLLWTLIQVPTLYAIYRLGKHLLATRQRAVTQLALVTAGALTIVVLDYVDKLTTIPPAPGFPHSTLGVFVFYVCVGVALFRFDLLDVTPIARETVVEDLRDPVLVVDREDRVVDHNDAAVVVFSALAGRDRIPVEEACPEVAAVLAEPSGADDGSMTRLTRTSHGDQRHYAVTVSDVTADGEPTGWYSVLLRDVTELERSRAELQAQNERLEQVASTVSHDLRNPITVATGYVDLLETELEDEQLVDYLERVDRSHERMLEIIDDILTIAREGKTVEETTTLELGAVAERAWATVETGEASLVVDAAGTIRADRSKLLTILENLFRNALDHGPDDVTVAIGRTETGFVVQDDGPGIPAETADDVFEFGYTTGDGTTGLGLSIVRTMTEAHGWTVDLDTEHGTGARFVFDRISEPGSASDDTEPDVPTHDQDPGGGADGADPAHASDDADHAPGDADPDDADDADYASGDPDRNPTRS